MNIKIRTGNPFLKEYLKGKKSIMKADGGTLLYIILAVISLIVSVIRQSNKKKAGIPVPPSSSPDKEENQPNPQSTWQKELEDIFGKRFSVPEEKGEVTTYEEVEKQKAPEREISYSQEIIDVQEAKEKLERTYAGETITNEQSHMSSIYSYKPNDLLEDYALEPVVSEEFELRKAIIYSEVLNRKYF
jgi:cell division protein FtsN